MVIWHLQSVQFIALAESIETIQTLTVLFSKTKFFLWCLNLWPVARVGKFRNDCWRKRSSSDHLPPPPRKPAMRRILSKSPASACLSWRPPSNGGISSRRSPAEGLLRLGEWSALIIKGTDWWEVEYWWMNTRYAISFSKYIILTYKNTIIIPCC